MLLLYPLTKFSLSSHRLHEWNEMFIDTAKIFVEAGRGGSGCVSFRREKFVPKGGPDGGNGGHGGSVTLKVDANLRTLLDFQHRKHYRATRGEHGKGSNKTGHDGEDITILVPPGTIIREEGSERVLADMINVGETFVIARGGRGGRGNATYVTSTNQAPREWEPGELGESRWLMLELKLIAEVGLVGLPNAGKSTLLSRISAARPKIADYPFTTLTPNLGVVRVGEYNNFVVADIPGLIEGAHEGRGLGMEFLRHIERTRVLAILIDATSEDWEATYQTLLAELRGYDESLLEKPRIIALSKMDLCEDKTIGEIFLRKLKPPSCRISAATGEGMREFLDLLWQAVTARR